MLQHVNTKLQLSDIFTKALSIEAFTPLRNALVVSLSQIGGIIAVTGKQLAESKSTLASKGVTGLGTIGTNGFDQLY